MSESREPDHRKKQKVKQMSWKRGNEIHYGEKEKLSIGGRQRDEKNWNLVS